MRSVTLLALQLWSAVVVAAPTPSTLDACKAIQSAVPGKLFYPGDGPYKQENSDYYNIGLSELMPACIVRPTLTPEVAEIVKILNKFADVKFAVKSGGHDPNAGHSSVRDGVLIALSQMKGVEYDKAKKVVYLKPGGQWSGVIKELEKDGVTIVGGRIGAVGLGGYLMQGGLSYLSSQYGMAADQIVEYETVLANGTIAHINQQTNKDLVVAMRGGGDQFGITTKFTLTAYPIGKIWGGIRIFTQRDPTFAALHDFIGGQKDPKAAIIFTTMSNPLGGSLFLVFFFYDGEKPPAGTFGKFEQLRPLIDMVKVQPYSDMVSLAPSSSTGVTMRTAFRSITLPYLASRPGWYSEIEAKWANITKSKLSGLAALTGPQHTIAFQPFGPLIGRASEARGGNSMGIKGSDPPRFILEITSLWSDKKDDEAAQGYARALTEWIEQQLKEVSGQASAKGDKVADYLPYFMNDAFAEQNVTGSYRDYERFKRAKAGVDPSGFWTRAGGFKY
ncbi:FAD-binding domain-containing protein [Trichodelitschia bisporula]|uniref:FAD-binding domain-containing protein n=1 Tax=Trichodelitschia bisporula TaxID=703511 RepID=A0A6G1HP40_9PEZI|nr:FAD-binding domain-containing protein [Trichodelitschia bisporula]